MEEEKAPSAAAPPPAKKGKGLWIGIAAAVIVVVILVGLVLAGFFNPPAEKDTTLVIGTVLPLTGGLSAYGPSSQKAALLAVKEINSRGGVLGHPIQIFTADSKTDPAAGRDAATALIQTNHVDAIIGAMGSGISAAVLQVTAANQVVQVSPASTSPIFSNLTFTKGWFFRTAPSDALQGVVAAHYAYTNRSWRTMAVIGINNPYGNGLATVFADTFTALGGTITVKEIIPEAQASYNTVLTDVFSKGAVDAIYFVAYPDTGVQLMSDWWAGRANWPTQWLFSEGLQSQGDFIDQLVSRGIDVSQMEGSAPVSPSGALYDAFVQRYKAEYNGESPALFASNTYDAVYMIATAALKAGEATGPAIRSKMLDISRPPGTVVNPGPDGWAATNATGTADVDYEGASGSLNWDQYGDPTSAYEIWGMNATNQIVRRAFFPESQVVAWTTGAIFVPSGFLGSSGLSGLMAAPVDRRT